MLGGLLGGDDLRPARFRFQRALQITDTNADRDLGLGVEEAQRQENVADVGRLGHR
jgi:hypothetical protein